jgi:sporulation protein YlmC with PRC-barrel domain
MIRNLLATTAIATLVATGAYAQATAPAPSAAPMEQAAPNVKQAEGHLASNIIGETVYSSSADDAENIGEVNDIVLSPEGEVQAIVVGVGGFLGLGQKNVALEYALVEWVERDGDEWLVVPTNREALEALEEFDVAAFEPRPADTQAGNTEPAKAEDIGAAEAAAEAEADVAETDDMAAAPADDAAPAEGDDMAAAPADGDAMSETDDDMAAAPAEGDDAAGTEDRLAADEEAAPAETDDMAAAPAEGESTAETDDTQTSAIDRSTLTDVDESGLSADNLIGTTVYGANDENVGEIGDVILSSEGDNVEAVTIDVGGFLGIGEKEVAVGMENLSFMQDEDGNMYLYTQFTQEQLEAQPEYDETTYAEARDDQLLIVPAE